MPRLVRETSAERRSTRVVRHVRQEEQRSMSHMRHSTPLHLLGLVSSLLLMLAGCGGQSGSSGDGQRSTVGSNRLALQISIPERAGSTQQFGTVASSATRQVTPGSAGF